MKPITIAVLGGTGKAGTYLVKQLQAQGFSLKLLLRHPDHYQNDHPDTEVVAGDARNEASIRSLLTGCEAVISTLGQPKGESPIFREATQLLLKAMPDYGIRRYITVTGLQVDTPADKKGHATQAATNWMKTNFPAICTDRQREYELLTQSDLDWTLVRLPMIEQTEARFPVQVSTEDAPGQKISATDLAHFLINQLKDDTHIQQSPFISNV